MHKDILIIGLGITGFSIARYLRYKQREFLVYDTRLEPPRLAEFQQDYPAVDVYCQDYPEDLLEKVEKIILSPGVALDIPLLQEARRRELLIENDLDCVAVEIKKKPLIAITGSNGKSTVTTWVAEIATKAGLKVAVGGNLGTPVLDLWLAASDYDLWVLELSSFQLAAMQRIAMTVSTVLNVSPDHLDMHASMEDYIAAKQRIFACTPQAVFNRDDVNTWPKYNVRHLESFGLSTPTRDSEWGILCQGQQKFLAKGLDPWIDVAKLKLKGQHNWQNALATCALAHMAGISKQNILAGLEDFGGLHHRTEWVACIDGVTYINDSKGTNLGATWAAINGIGPTIEGQIVLIAGGLGKGADFTPLRASLSRFVKHVILIGHDAPILEQCWQDAVKLSHAASLKEAVEQSAAIAIEGDLVLLSPACASFDMFKGFEHRGQQFSQLVLELQSC